MNMSENIHTYKICWKDTLQHPPAHYLPSLMGYILVTLAPQILGVCLHP